MITSLKAQESTFNKGDNVINLGIGIGSYYGTGTYNSTTVPPISISYERGIVDSVFDKVVIGVGAYLAYTSYKWNYNYANYDYGWKYSNIVFGAKGTFHYPLIEKVDTYAGLLLGYNILSSKSYGSAGEYDYSPDSGSLAFSINVGGRYYFSENFSAFIEFGYGISILTLGISTKF